MTSAAPVSDLARLTELLDAIPLRYGWYRQGPRFVAWVEHRGVRAHAFGTDVITALQAALDLAIDAQDGEALS